MVAPKRAARSNSPSAKRRSSRRKKGALGALFLLATSRLPGCPYDAPHAGIGQGRGGGSPGGGGRTGAFGARLHLFVLGRIRSVHHSSQTRCRRVRPEATPPAAMVVAPCSDCSNCVRHFDIRVSRQIKRALRGAPFVVQPGAKFTPNSTSRTRPDAACARSGSPPASSVRYRRR
jgi:hypothetical protein